MITQNNIKLIQSLSYSGSESDSFEIFNWIDKKIGVKIRIDVCMKTDTDIWLSYDYRIWVKNSMGDLELFYFHPHKMDLPELNDVFDSAVNVLLNDTKIVNLLKL